MKRWLTLFACVALAPGAARADDNYLTPSQIETLQKHGWITPPFEVAAREWIDSKQATEHAKTDSARFDAELPGLQKEADTEDAKIAQLKDQLDHYDHPDETDFTALQAMMKDSHAQLDDQMARAQAYVWTYPESPHEPDAAKDLQQLQKKIADQLQAATNATAAAAAAQAKLLQRVKSHDLSLGEWRAFLQDKSQAEVTDYLGAPEAQDNDDHWVYQGAWTIDPATNQKAGLQLTFNGGHVQNVAPVPISAPAAVQ